MADSYNTLNYRNLGGSTWSIGGELAFLSGGYMSNVLVSATSTLTPLIIGAMNYANGETTGPLVFTLPTAVAGADVWFYGSTEIATTGRAHIVTAAGTASIDVVIGTASELGMFEDNNNMLTATGSAIHLKAVNSSQWLVVSNDGGAQGTTVAGTTA